MKKILIILILASLYSCGPKRLGCGPSRRCDVDTQKEMIKAVPQKNPEVKTSGLV
jgi:predicted small lipoprotein YifL